MTIALLAAGLDPGIGMFHADIDNRSSLALDAIEAVRPHVDRWLLGYLASSAFANRDFTELSDGEVRVSHPLHSHLAHTAALWRNMCEPVANWLAQSFSRAAGFGAVLVDNRKSGVAVKPPAKVSEQGGPFDSIELPPGLDSPARRSMPMRGALKEVHVPSMCWECGKALVGRQRRFCSSGCAIALSIDRQKARRGSDLVDVR